MPLCFHIDDLCSQASIQAGQLDLAALKKLVEEYENQALHFGVVQKLFSKHSRALNKARASRDAQVRGGFIKRLPIELVGRIFIFAVTVGLEQWTSIFDESDHPLNWFRLAHVNTHWRKVALATPQLWSIIAIDYSPTVDLLQFLFDLSRACPLRVRFTPESQDVAPDVLALLHMHSTRISALQFNPLSLRRLNDYK